MLFLIHLMFLLFSLVEYFSTFLKCASGKGALCKHFGFTTFSVVLFPVTSPVASAVLWIIFLEAAFAVASPYLPQYPIIFSHICWIDLSQMTKILILYYILILLVL